MNNADENDFIEGDEIRPHDPFRGGIARNALAALTYDH